MEGCIAHKRKYQELLYQKYSSDMYRVCLMYTDDRDEASDVLQDSFIKVFRKIGDFRFEGSLKGWIRRTVVLTAINAFNKKKKEREHIVAMKDTVYQPVRATINEIISEFEVREIIAKVNQLPTKAQQVLKLYALEGYKHKEIAEILGISEGTSKSQFNRAKYLLQLSLQKSDG